MSHVAELFFPAIRWDEQHGYEAQRAAMDQALDRGVGGFILFGGPAEQVAALTERLHSDSGNKLLIGADLERGAGQQFSGATALPPLAAIASLRSLDDVRRAAALTAREARGLGVNWIYAPDCDLDIEPNNPIIGTRSFGGDPAAVATDASAWIEACQAERVLACAKHFPGHGRTTADSHAELPTVKASAAELRQTDLAPFKAAIAAGAASIMSAHVAFPALDDSRAPATLSAPILRTLLRDELGFRGLVVTDALIMEGVLRGGSGGSGGSRGSGGGEPEAVVRALAAGCDCLLYPNNLAASMKAVTGAIDSNALDWERIEGSLHRRAHWADWAAIDSGFDAVQHDDSEWAVRLAERTVHWVSGAAPLLQPPVRVVVVDDDLGGPYPAPSREPFVETLREGGVTVLGDEDTAAIASRATVIALYGDVRAWKGRPGYSVSAKKKVAALIAESKSRGAIVVQFSHPRLAAGLATDVPILCAWGGEAVMQRAAARVLLQSM